MYSRLVFKIGLYSRAGYDGAYMVLNHGHFETNYRYLPLKKSLRPRQDSALDKCCPRVLQI